MHGPFCAGCYRAISQRNGDCYHYCEACQRPLHCDCEGDHICRPRRCCRRWQQQQLLQQQMLLQQQDRPSRPSSTNILRPREIAIRLRNTFQSLIRRLTFYRPP